MIVETRFENKPSLGEDKSKQREDAKGFVNENFYNADEYRLAQYRRLSKNENVQIIAKTKEEAVDEFKNRYGRNELFRLPNDGILYSANKDPNYLQSDAVNQELMSGYLTCVEDFLKNPNVEFSLERILHIHTLMTKDAIKINKDVEPGVIREGVASFDFWKDKLTREGLIEYLKELEKDKDGYLELAYFEPGYGSKTYRIGAHERTIKIEGKEDIHIITIDQYLKILKETLADFNYDEKNKIESLADFLLKYPTHVTPPYQDESTKDAANQTDPNQEHIMGLMNKIIAAYHADIKATNENSAFSDLEKSDIKLEIIGRTLTHFLMLHPFGDGNTRTFKWIASELLLMNGFPPATLYDSKLFFAYGHQEDLLKRGILNTENIYQNKAVFGYHTALRMSRESTQQFVEGQVKQLAPSIVKDLSYTNPLLVNIKDLESKETIDLLLSPFPDTMVKLVFLNEAFLATEDVKIQELLSASYLDYCDSVPYIDLAFFKYNIDSLKKMDEANNSLICQEIESFNRNSEIYQSRIGNEDLKSFYRQMQTLLTTISRPLDPEKSIEFRNILKRMAGLGDISGKPMSEQIKIITEIIISVDALFPANKKVFGFDVKPKEGRAWSEFKEQNSKILSELSLVSLQTKNPLFNEYYTANQAMFKKHSRINIATIRAANPKPEPSNKPGGPKGN